MKISMLFPVSFALLTLQSCLTVNMGTIGYLEPSNQPIEKGVKLSEKCENVTFWDMKGSFETLLNNAKDANSGATTFQSVVFIMQPRSLDACVEMYGQAGRK